ncbi:MAG: hypothetical protein AAF196_20625 [Planctomycetota bacterium]
MTVIGIAIWLWLTRHDERSPAPPNDETTRSIEASADPKTETLNGAEPDTEPAQRQSAERGDSITPTDLAVEANTVLRVILEDLPGEDAARAKITVATYDVSKERTARIKETWSSQGSTSEFELESHLAEVAERFEAQDFDELKVAV